MEDAKSFLLSRTIWGALIALVAVILKGRYEIDVEGWTTDVIGLIGVALAIFGRVKATKPLKVS